MTGDVIDSPADRQSLSNSPLSMTGECTVGGVKSRTVDTLNCTESRLHSDIGPFELNIGDILLLWMMTCF